MADDKDVAAIAAGLTEAQLDLARHALGLDRGKVAYRNHYMASPDTMDDFRWAGMVALGAAELAGSPRPGLPYNCYRVSPAVKSHLEVGK